MNDAGKFCNSQGKYNKQARVNRNNQELKYDEMSKSDNI